MLTLPNALSLSRIISAPVLVVAIAKQAELVVICGFVLVIISDILDGHIARRRAQTSSAGTLIDHSSDAVFVTVMTSLFGYLGLLPGVLPLVIALAFVQYVIDSRSSGEATLRASKLGRWNGIAYFVITAVATLAHLYTPYPLVISSIYWFGWLLVLTTVSSMISRAIHFARARRK